MAYLIEDCSSCGKKISMSIAQTFWKGRVDTHASYFCKECSNLTEIDWINEEPEGRILEALRKQDGLWTLQIRSQDKDRILIMKTLKDELNLGMDKIKEIIKNFDNLKLDGTKAEMEKMAYAFSKAGITAYIERIQWWIIFSNGV